MGFYIEFTPGLLGAAAVVFPVVCTFLVAFRFAGRLRRNVRLGVDDWLVVPALAFLIGMGCFSVYGIAVKSQGYTVPYGEEVDHPREVASNLVFWNTEWLQCLSLGCIKLSFVFFYRRIFSRTKAFNIASIAVIVILILWTISFFVSMMTICPGNVSAYWEAMPDRTAYCWTTTEFLYAYAWSDVGTDLMVLILPIPCVVKLHMTTKRKLAVIGVFLFGSLSLVASLLRGAQFVYFLHLNDDFYADPLMLDTNGIYWMLLETGLALIAVNLPVLYGVVRLESSGSFFSSLRSLVSTRSSKSGSSLHSEDSSPAVTKISEDMSMVKGEKLRPAHYSPV